MNKITCNDFIKEILKNCEEEVTFVDCLIFIDESTKTNIQYFSQKLYFVNVYTISNISIGLVCFLFV